MLYLSLLLAAALSYVTPATAATGVGGTITTTTWTKALSPYRVTGTITVPSNNTLTIEPGVDVLFDADVQFVVQGKLYAVGTQADSIRFLKGTAVNWRGIRISGGDISTIAHTRISDGKARGSTRQDSCGGALCLSGNGTRVGMSNSVISGNGASGGGGGVYAWYSTATLTNCTITANRARAGGGLSVSSSTVTMTNCTITGNSASGYGGGMDAYNSSTLTLTNCTITGNLGSNHFWETGNGGGLSAYSSTLMLTNCTITGNSSFYGGGVYADGSTLTLTNCTISGNLGSGRWQALSHGGGLGAISSTVTMTNCSITGNRVIGHGGGLSAEYSSTLLTLTNCTITGNSAAYGNGGGLYAKSSSTVMLTNCTITGNSAHWNGGGLRASSSTVTLTNCTISRNTASQYGGGVYAWYSTVTLKNTILWGDSPQEISSRQLVPSLFSSPLFITATYSDVQGGWPSTGNINADPLFVDAINRDYRLQSGSPCIDAGDPTSPKDSDGSRADMGALPYRSLSRQAGEQ